MNYLIDGHNLIPNIPGLSLSDPDDEEALIRLLLDFCRYTRSRVEVFFDRSSSTQQTQKEAGNLRVIFVRQGSNADSAIINRMQRMRGEAFNWTVVSTDRQVQAAAHSYKAKVVRSEDFARLLAKKPVPTQSTNPTLTDEEIDYWLKEFNR
jgi:predicted RNA-binding protein with PIN domain